MRLINVFNLTFAIVVAAVFAGATSASATSTQLCSSYLTLACGGEDGVGTLHVALEAGTVWKLLALINVLCLGALVEVNPLGLGNPQSVHGTSMSFSGCGTGSAHNNCTVTVQEQPLSNLLKTGLDEGVLTATSGRLRLQCPNLGIDCVFDTVGSELSVGSNHITADEMPINELGGKFFCPGEGLLDVLYDALYTGGPIQSFYVLG
ncbi:MAG TPA: hypothetical protein VF093_12060 [Solirubrobacterales bacterium]